MNSLDVPAQEKPRVTPNLRHAFGGVWQLTFRQYFAPKQWMILFGPSILLGLLIVSTVHPGQSTHFYQLLGGFYFAFLVPVLAFISGAGAIRDEIKAADYLATRPLPRPAFVVFKFLAHCACVQLAFLFALAVLVALGEVRNVADLTSGILTLVFAQVLEIAAFVGLGLLSGVLTSRYLLIGLFYGAMIELGLGAIPTQLSRLSITHQIQELIAPVVHKHNFHLGSGEVSSDLTTSGTILLFTLGTVAAAAVIFRLQELEGSHSREG